jgi:hypothetical protein
VFADDVQARFEEIKNYPGIRTVSPVVAIQPDMHSFYVRDPDGMPVEFMQVLRK